MGFGGAQRLLVLALLCASPLALVEAQSSLSFLKDAPAGHFNQKDWDLLRGAMREALEGTDDAPKLWENNENGHSGKVTAVKRYTAEGRDCRRLQFENQADGPTNRSHYELCRDPDGSWREVSSGMPIAGLGRTR